MAFQIKSFVSVVAAMINNMRGTQARLTDFNVGSVSRTLVEAPAAEIDELYQQMFTGIKEAIPVATYRSFNFDTLAAVPASGVVRLTISPSAVDVVISAGTAASSPTASVSYASVHDVTIAAGNTTADVLFSATAAGVAGNIAANTAFSLTPQPVGLVSAINPAAFSNGSEVETDDQKKQRFRQFIQTLQRGTIAAIEYGSRTAFLTDLNGVETERVRAASVIEPYVTDSTQPISLVDVYVHNGVGATSGGLVGRTATILAGYVDAAGNKVPGWKAAGVKVVVASAAEVTVAVTAAVTVDSAYVQAAVLADVSAVISNYILGLDIGQPFLFSEAVKLAMETAGVLNVVFTTPTADHTATQSQKLMPGAFAVTAA